jgi:MFS family permease
MQSRHPLARYLAGAVTARTGNEMSGPALMLAGFAVSGSATEASVLLAGITIAAAAGGPVLGALLDRAARPGALLTAAVGLHALGLAVILNGLGHLPVVIIVAIAVATGLFGPALSGGWTAQLPRVASKGILSRANSLDAMTFTVAGLVGPALAGGAAELFTAPAAVAVSVLLVGLALPAAWRLPRNPATAGDRLAGSVAGDLAAGVRCIARTRALSLATLTSVLSCMGEGMLITCSPLLGDRVLGGAGRGAMLLSCIALSSLAANAVLARFPRSIAPDTIIWAGAVVQAAALALAAAGRPALLIGGALLAGIGEGPQLTALFTVRHRESPERLRSQVFTTGASLKITALAIGAAAAGPIATWSLPWALMTAAAVEILAVVSRVLIPIRS